MFNILNTVYSGVFPLVITCFPIIISSQPFNQIARHQAKVLDPGRAKVCLHRLLSLSRGQTAIQNSTQEGVTNHLGYSERGRVKTYKKL